MQAQKNLPQPLLVKEGRKKRHYLSGSGSSRLRFPGCGGAAQERGSVGGSAAI